MAKVWKVVGEKSSDVVEQILINRGIKTKLEKEKFFNPNLHDFEKELNLPGIEKSLKRIKRAIEDSEQIVVYGDYDVDGICASAIIYKALSSIGARVIPYIPHREKEGYGLSKVGLDFCKESGAKLVITVDHGIVALAMAEYAKSISLDLIITDHHLPLNKKPEAYSIVHSTRICGAGVAWCLVRGIISSTLAEELLEYVALATVCDQMELLGVNRALVYQGLKKLNTTLSIGLKTLIDQSGVEGKITSYSIGHNIGPLLNAVGRLGDAMDALRLLCTKDPVKARKLAQSLHLANLKRKELTEVAVEQARLLVTPSHKIHVLSSDKWIPGIIGLVAARMSEEYNVPAIAISEGGAHSKGSARSIDGVNIVELIRTASEYLIDLGGHSGAAGFSIETKKITQFRKKLLESFNMEKTEDFLNIDARVESKKLDKKLSYDLEKLEPFGNSNPQPVFASKVSLSNLRVLSSGKHLKGRADGIDFIAFGFGKLIGLLSEGQVVDLAYNLEINKFNGSENLQLKVRDIKFD